VKPSRRYDGDSAYHVALCVFHCAADYSITTPDGIELTAAAAAALFEPTWQRDEWSWMSAL